MKTSHKKPKAKTKKHDFYTYRVTWSGEDQQYVGLCAEFPSLSWLAGKPDGAIKGIRKVVQTVLRDMQKHKETIPEPLSVQNYSGKFLVRVPPLLHKHLAMEAAESGVSLNRLVSARLSR